MNKWIKSFLILLGLVMLTGCSNKTLTCKKEDNSTSSTGATTLKLYYKENVLNKISTKTTIEIIDDSSIEDLKKLYEESYSVYKEYTGFSYKIESKDNTLMIDLESDYPNLNEEERNNLGLSELGKSLEEDKNFLEKEDYTCK